MRGTVAVIAMAFTFANWQAFAASSERVNLTQPQRQLIEQGVSKLPAQVAPSTFIASVGLQVPNQLNLMSLPEQVTSEIPALKDLDFARLQTGKILIVDPSSRSIVAIIQ